MHLPQCFLQAWQLMVLTDGLGERFLHAGQGGVHCRFHQRPHGLLMQTCGQRVDRYETTKMEQCRVIVVEGFEVRMDNLPASTIGVQRNHAAPNNVCQRKTFRQMRTAYLKPFAGQYTTFIL